MTQEFDLGDDTEEIIGRGTWIDKLALSVLERKDNLKGKHPEVIRTESGLGASGFPHIGSFADASRAFGFKLAIEDLDRKSEYIAFADDMDGLRKVPVGTPPELKEHLGKPVSMIPDPWGCHDSYGQHMSSLLIDSIKEAGIICTPTSANELYTSGKMAPQVKKLLTQAKRAGEIIEETTGQEKYLVALPYHAICKQCGKIYTTKSISFDDKKGQVEYVCEGDEIRGKMLDGCSYHGWADIAKGEGKLTWKVEFAARWDLLQIDFEAFGKDIFESVTCNDQICKEIFDYEPPTHARYEMFLDKGGSKISKSTGNVFTPQTWFSYGSTQSLALLTYKRMSGSRSLSVDDIPIYMKELDYLENIYFGRIKEGNAARKRKLNGLFEYCWHLKQPEKKSIQVPYSLLVNLISVAPESAYEEFIETRLIEYGYLRDGAKYEDVKERVQYAANWVKDFAQLENITIELDEKQKASLKSLIKEIKDLEEADDIQSTIFEIARQFKIEPRDFFKILYQILLNTDRGPKLGPYIQTIGTEHAIKTIKKNLK
ncbi:MAG: lysine--tRNA ligase [Candidatus Heimdallarchaeota archaeon]|nr:lysine--tRNA ligase [Candidatus Heimdallarchaeota archaeon]MBY8994982.1 lysine--tRNA ligase [Candidatus Heimdallarchaeota archaeon]